MYLPVQSFACFPDHPVFSYRHMLFSMQAFPLPLAKRPSQVKNFSFTVGIISFRFLMQNAKKYLCAPFIFLVVVYTLATLNKNHQQRA